MEKIINFILCNNENISFSSIISISSIISTIDENFLIDNCSFEKINNLPNNENKEKLLEHVVEKYPNNYYAKISLALYYKSKSKKIDKMLSLFIQCVMCGYETPLLELFDYYDSISNKEQCNFYIDFIFENKKISIDQKIIYLKKIIKINPSKKIYYCFKLSENNNFCSEIFKITGDSYYDENNFKIAYFYYSKLLNNKKTIENLFNVGKCFMKNGILLNNNNTKKDDSLYNIEYDIINNEKDYDKIIQNENENEILNFFDNCVELKLDGDENQLDSFFSALYELISYHKKKKNSEKLLFYLKIGEKYRHPSSFEELGNFYRSLQDRKLQIKYYEEGAKIENLACVNELMKIYEKEKNYDKFDDCYILKYKISGKLDLSSLQQILKENFMPEKTIRKYFSVIRKESAKNIPRSCKKFFAKQIINHRMDFEVCGIKFFDDEDGKECHICREIKYYNICCNCKHEVCASCFYRLCEDAKYDDIVKCSLCRQDVFE
jgi:hypothetical protein